jgi:hypothetical protein|tara:strand:- start:213 stop:350 length:138 start_codon:yes stop_codon:yes gene_type:complete
MAKTMPANAAARTLAPYHGWSQLSTTEKDVGSKNDLYKKKTPAKK